MLGVTVGTLVTAAGPVQPVGVEIIAPNLNRILPKPEAPWLIKTSLPSEMRYLLLLRFASLNFSQYFIHSFTTSYELYETEQHQEE